MNVNDELFGCLEYDDSWIGAVSLPFFSEVREAELVIECYEGEEITELQKRSFRHLLLDPTALMSEVNDKIFAHYKESYQEYRTKFGIDARDELAPEINSTDEMISIIDLKTVFLPQAPESNMYLGIIYTCSWEPELGLGVKVVNGSIQVGTQDLVL
ncbi:hypothetical protein AHAT_11870 [Agarivorans sp. Toyoura001]|uniref:DUF6985 domain-containing protein n=1 Tax=Agarivorans sp. Toyoura001 TaxID=2283141 RepID=UPI0010F33842|nr:hypothetical protein [Agarivorans sp. Toyoura001]GDY25297.1 hypothetical protein AHAT_11870 [Agarivorans sp. Toyoura001]